MKRRYPKAPVVSVGAIIIKVNKVLLVKRAHEPSRGLWSIPGGVVELGETAQEALRREVKEECGLKIDIGPVFDVVNAIVKGKNGRIVYHYVIIDFLARYKSGNLKIASDIRNARWFRKDEITDLPMPSRAKKIVLRTLGRKAGIDKSNKIRE